MPQRHLIIGGAGLIGATLAGSLANSDREVMCVDSFRATRVMPQWRRSAYDWRLSRADGASIVELDIREHDLMRRLIGSWQPDVVYFLAALLAGESTADPREAEEVQVHAFRNVVEAVERLPGPVHLVLASSSYVYGNCEGITVTESARRAPVDVYGRMKAIAEDILTARPPSPMTHTILRPASVYGVGDPRRRFATSTIEESVRFGGARVKHARLTADFTHVDDVARAFQLAGNRIYHQLVLNVTRGETRTYADLARCIRHVESGVDIVVDDEKIPETVPRRGEIDCTLARNTMGWTADVGLADGVKLEVANAKALYSAQSPRIEMPEEIIQRFADAGLAAS